MAQFEITVDEADLSKLFTGQGLSSLVEQVLNQVLAHQVTAALKAQPGERTPERVGYRNGREYQIFCVSRSPWFRLASFLQKVSRNDSWPHSSGAIHGPRFWNAAGAPGR